MTHANPTRPTRVQPPPATGIVHLGLGAFFRAHGAVYISEAMAAAGGDWGIVGVSLRSPAVRDADAAGRRSTPPSRSRRRARPAARRVVPEVLVAPEDPDAVLAVMAAETTRIVSLTITEKGYCHEPAGSALDLAHPDIVHDLAGALPRSALGFIARALEIRRRKRPQAVHRPVAATTCPRTGA